MFGFLWLVHDDSEGEREMRKKNNFPLPSLCFWLEPKKWWTKEMRWLWLDLFHNDGNDNYSDDDGSNSADTASECDDGSIWDDDGNDKSIVFVVMMMVRMTPAMVNVHGCYCFKTSWQKIMPLKLWKWAHKFNRWLSSFLIHDCRYNIELRR